MLYNQRMTQNKAWERMLSKWVTESSVRPGQVRYDVSFEPEPKLFMAAVSA